VRLDCQAFKALKAKPLLMYCRDHTKPSAPLVSLLPWTLGGRHQSSSGEDGDSLVDAPSAPQALANLQVQRQAPGGAALSPTHHPPPPSAGGRKLCQHKMQQQAASRSAGRGAQVLGHGELHVPSAASNGPRLFSHCGSKMGFWCRPSPRRGRIKTPLHSSVSAWQSGSSGSAARSPC